MGGLPARAGSTRSGRVVRSDSFVHLTEAGLRAVEEYGVTVVIDLRSPAEVLASPNPVSMASHIPLLDDAAMRRLSEAATTFERYLLMLELGRPAFGRVLDVIAKADGCVVFHCFAGKDRTGLVAALLLAAAGVPDDAIATDFAETDVHLAGRYMEWMAAAAPERRAALEEELSCPPERILGVLEHVRCGWGGVEGFLEAAGMRPVGIDRLAARLA